MPDPKKFTLNAHRLTREPEEKRILAAWMAINGGEGRGHPTLDYLLDPTGNPRPGTATARDRRVAGTVIQWLGSHVGECFLRDLGYVKAAPDA